MNLPRHPRRRALLGILAAAAAGTSRAQAPTFPARTMRMILPFAPGGGPDTIGRRVAEGLATRLGTNIVVENRVGATGMIGLAELARAAPDGHTIGLVLQAHTVAQAMQAKPVADLVRDTAPFALIGRQYTVLCVGPGSPARSVADLAQMLKAAPGAHTFGSGGNGTPAHIAGELFRRTVGADARHIPYKALTVALTDVGRGEVSYIFSIGNSAIPLVRNGRLRALAVAAPQRVPAIPDVPTLAESGISGVEVYSWTGLVAPAGTPPAIVEVLNRATRDVLGQSAVRQAFENAGIDVMGGSAEEFASLVKSESARWAAFVRQTGITAD
ncbi:MAG: tripartite tricarboxylate transporter substrate binding protein [Burkholderiales bacterium]|nr:tripartite tricarboxylate transporter substrate binding protein [Burkholderiales bacterium]